MRERIKDKWWNRHEYVICTRTVYTPITKSLLINSEWHFEWEKY